MNVIPGHIYHMLKKIKPNALTAFEILIKVEV